MFGPGAQKLRSAAMECDLVRKFNNRQKSLKVFILMYNVGAQGVNLDPSCRYVIVATGAINASLEIQAWGKVVWVSAVLSYRYGECA